MPKLEVEFKEFIGDGNLIVLTSIESYQKILLEMLQYLINKKDFSGVLVTVNKPYNMLKEMFEKDKINLDNLVIVDCISSSSEKREGNVVFMPRPFSATNVSILLDQLSVDSNVKFFIFDTINNILTYDGTGIVRFFQYTTSNLVTRKKLTIILGIDLDTQNKEVNLISQSCNKVIKV
jgi:archaellum biogenesis ATPase FlaH